MKIKALIFYFLIIIISIFSTELISYGLLKIKNSNKKNIASDTFRVRDFSERTQDSRLITMKKNFSKKDIKSIKVSEKKNWSIFTSNFRTRIVENDKGLNFINIINDPDIPKFLFIGDSVPFGLGLDAESSIPFLFGQNNNKYFSLNGAVPSYSLQQSVDRFFIEFKDIKNLKYVYLQIYDPASQYHLLGSKWLPKDNWTNRSDQVLRRYKFLNDFLNLKFPLYGELYSFTIIKKLLTKFHEHKIPVTPSSIASDKRFIKHVNFQLNKIFVYLNSINAKLILAPVTIPQERWESNNNSQHLRVVKLLNDTIKKFSTENDIIFIDTETILKKDSKKNFIDMCCHLSREGADRVASHLRKKLLIIK